MAEELGREAARAPAARPSRRSTGPAASGGGPLGDDAPPRRAAIACGANVGAVGLLARAARRTRDPGTRLPRVVRHAGARHVERRRPRGHRRRCPAAAPVPTPAAARERSWRHASCSRRDAAACRFEPERATSCRARAACPAAGSWSTTMPVAVQARRSGRAAPAPRSASRALRPRRSGNDGADPARRRPPASRSRAPRPGRTSRLAARPRARATSTRRRRVDRSAGCRTAAGPRRRSA